MYEKSKSVVATVGASRISEEVQKRCDLTLSFSKITFLHKLIQLVLLGFSD
ncbi:23S rRNA (pseudouridine(1915)-N(3))-methyltransferase RlmH [Oceanobacillus neutriphilus]|uniref:23S rRNA (pseudouridine(1915)-N(3))-methyltransferase RlmH n=1 Tax=Oceanobacillus neutriphilus TaxID=531815 RepID=UPI001665DAF7|nr:23S rRNA (pseudouridine(1915)-N(3))-methyltransferase RlmH [Oceanobacillus neutriphilus]